MSRCRHSRMALCVCMLAGVIPASAAEVAAGGLDLLVIVDRSASMLPYESAMAQAVPLALHVVTWNGRTSKVRHRLGVISFGSQARVDVPLTAVSDDTLPSLRARIAAAAQTSLGETNFAAAFSAAAAAFDAVPEDAARRRAVLILTDGHAYGPASVNETAAAAADRLLPRNVTVDLLLFGPETDSWRRLSRNRLHRVTGAPGELLPVLHRVVTGMVGTRVVERTFSGTSAAVVLPPYLDLVVFDLFTDSSTEAVSIVPPGAVRPLDRATRGVEEVVLGGTMSTVVVRRPAPGTWTFQSAIRPARVTVLSQTFFPRGVLIGPPGAPPPRQHDHVAIVYRMDDGSGGALQELPAHPLTVDVAVVRPDGKRELLPMLRAGAALPLVYRTPEKVACDATGRYWTEVAVTTSDSTGRPVVIFEDRWSGFTVDAAPFARRTTARLPAARVEAARTPFALLLTAAAAAAVGVAYRASRGRR